MGGCTERSANYGVCSSVEGASVSIPRSRVRVPSDALASGEVLAIASFVDLS